MRKKTEILKNAKNEGAALMRRTRIEAEDIIKTLKAQEKEQDEKNRMQAIRDARGRLRNMAEEVRPGFHSNPAYHERVDVSRLAPGDQVYIVPLDQKGDVLEVKGKELVVGLGGMKTTVKADVCRFISRAEKEDASEHEERGPQISSGALLEKASSTRHELDIRGCLVDEGEERVAKFIDDAAFAGLKSILIIHGKGTGALRKGIHEYLSRHKNVLAFRFADMDEGGLGATVVDLK